MKVIKLLLLLLLIVGCCKTDDELDKRLVYKYSNYWQAKRKCVGVDNIYPDYEIIDSFYIYSNKIEFDTTFGSFCSLSFKEFYILK